MLYQTILPEQAPFVVRIDRLAGFREHRHADIELHYCVRGSFEAVINKKKIAVREGDLLVIHPMVSHSFPKIDISDRQIMVAIFGISFLKNFFSYFASSSHAYRLISPSDSSLQMLLRETASLARSHRAGKELLLRGNLYKICAYLIEMNESETEKEPSANKKLIKIEKIEQALEMIYYEYTRPLTVEDAAKATGYEISNFCKIFKSVTGETFHRRLNRHRIERACELLVGTDLPISEIAPQVGFEELKTFCRVFHELTDLTPGQYRKNHTA